MRNRNLMDYGHLLARLRTPEVQRELLAGYHGSFSLGVSHNPDGPEGIGIRISVPEGSDLAVPESIILLGQRIPIEVVEDRVAISPFT